MQNPTGNDTQSNEDPMARGIRLHAEGRLEQALIAFEQARELRPADANVASACATLLHALARPAAALQVLLSVEQTLLASADGAANLAIAAESCGDLARARSAYQRALELDPAHLRSLNNVGLLAAADGQWPVAIDCARQCVDIEPAQASYRINLCDFLCGARRYDEALAALDAAAPLFPDDVDLRIRRATVLAFGGQFEASREASALLDDAARAHFKNFLQRGLAQNEERVVPHALPGLPDARQLFCDQAFEAMTVCDWRDNERLTATLRQMLAEAQRSGEGRDWRDAQLFGLMLDMSEDEMAQVRRFSIAKIGNSLEKRLAPFVRRHHPGLQRDQRIHVGLAVQSLSEPRHLHALERQLALHDHARFAIHVYSPTPRPDQLHAERLAPYTANLVELAHMTDTEAAARIRLDRLDLFVDMAFDTPWCRPEIPEMRVAPVQLRQLTWHRHHPPRPCEYNLSDRFVHPDDLDLAPYGAVVRLPETCWFALHDEAPASDKPARRDAGLPEDALILCSSQPSLMLDPATFALWMKLLRSLPDALLWLPACRLQAATHLVREAQAAGVGEERLLFSPRQSRADALAGLRHADLFLDSLRFNANQGLADALRLGVPAVSCAGHSMASRLGGSILRAAGLPEGVVDSPAAYAAEVLRLGRDAAALRQRREQLAAAAAGAPLFDLPARVRDLEAAWATMAERTRTNLPPVAFDVPARAGA